MQVTYHYESLRWAPSPLPTLVYCLKLRYRPDVRFFFFMNVIFVEVYWFFLFFSFSAPLSLSFLLWSAFYLLYFSLFWVPCFHFLSLISSLFSFSSYLHPIFFSLLSCISDEDSWNRPNTFLTLCWYSFSFISFLYFSLLFLYYISLLFFPTLPSSLCSSLGIRWPSCLSQASPGWPSRSHWGEMTSTSLCHIRRDINMALKSRWRAVDGWG